MLPHDLPKNHTGRRAPGHRHRPLVKMAELEARWRRMILLDVLASPPILVAIGCYAAGSALEPFIERWLERAVHYNPPLLWCWEHLGVPLLRAALLLGFVFLAYPTLFGLREAPGLQTLLADRDAAPSTVLGTLYLVALLAPVLPVFRRHPELVLPAQGVLAVAFLFHWLADYLHVTVASAWPGSAMAIAIVAAAWLMHRLSLRLGERLGRELDRTCGTDGYDALGAHMVTLLAQLPVVLVYSSALGAQLAL